MRMRKGQTAMEYLMTYGWAILIIMVVLAVLFYLGVLTPPVPSQCTFPAGITCTTTKLHAGSGHLTLEIGQGTGHSITVTGVTCTQNTSQAYATSGAILYTDYSGDPNITIASGSKGFVAKPGTFNVTCTDADGSSVDTSIGAQYNGRIYINYTEADTKIQRIAVGTFSARFEA
ncbi:MAG: hypothetical protein QXF56_04015 [Candidatus Micrarchaeia archaeon]